MADTNPKKKKKEESFDRGQQLSDKLASQVASGKLTYEQAMKKQKAQDRIASKVKDVGVLKRGSSQNLASKTEYKKARFKLDKHGNKVAY